MKLVVDASVVVKLMHEEDGSEDAVRLFVRAMDNDVELISSARMPSEVGNALMKHLNAEDGEPFIEQVFELDIDMVHIDKHLVGFRGNVQCNRPWNVLLRFRIHDDRRKRGGKVRHRRQGAPEKDTFGDRHQESPSDHRTVVVRG